MNKKILIPLLILITILSISFLFYTIFKKDVNNNSNNLDDDLEIIAKEEVTGEKKAGDLKISNISYSVRDGVTSYYAVVTNTTASLYKINSLYVLFKYKDSERKVLAIKDISLNSGNSTKINIKFDSDFSDIEKIDYIIN